MKKSLKIIFLLIWDLLVGSLMFLIVMMIALGTTIAMNWAAQKGFDPWMIEALKYVKGFVFILDTVLYVYWLMTSAVAFVGHQREG